MNQTEQLAVLLISCYVAFLIGQSKAKAAISKTSTAPDGSSTPATPDAPDSMAWFTNWSGLK